MQANIDKIRLMSAQLEETCNMNKVLAVRYQGLREENMRLKREVRE